MESLHIVIIFAVLFFLLFFFFRSFPLKQQNQKGYQVRLIGHQSKDLAQACRLGYVTNIIVEDMEIFCIEANRVNYSVHIGDLTAVTVKNDYDKVFDKRFWVRLSYTIGRKELIYSKIKDNKNKETLTKDKISSGNSYQMTVFFRNEEDERNFFFDINQKITEFNLKLNKEITSNSQGLVEEQVKEKGDALASENKTSSTIENQRSEKYKGIDEQITRLLAADLKQFGATYMEKFLSIVDKSIFFESYEELKARMILEFRQERQKNGDTIDEFIEGELLPFTEILTENKIFRWQNDYDILGLLKALKDLSAEKIYTEFLDKCSFSLREFKSDDFDGIITRYIRIFDSESEETTNLEGLRMYLRDNNHDISLEELARVVSYTVNKGQLARRKRQLELRLIEGEVNRYTISDTDILKDEDLKEFLLSLFKRNGFRALNVNANHNEVEIVLAKGKRMLAVIAKFNSGYIGKGTIEQAIGIKRNNDYEEVRVITNSYLSNGALTLAEANNITVWDRKILQDKLEKL